MNKKKAFLAFFLVLLAAANPSFLISDPGKELIVADFDDARPVNKLGGAVEVWLKEDGSDTTQFSRMSFVPEDALGKGQALRIDYDVDSPHAAFNGVRTDLKGVDLTGYKTLNFYLKGDEEAGFPEAVKIELIGKPGVPSPYVLQGLSGSWTRVSVPLSEFWGIQDWTSLQKFVVVFADLTSNPKTGTIYLDQITFSKE